MPICQSKSEFNSTREGGKKAKYMKFKLFRAPYLMDVRYLCRKIKRPDGKGFYRQHVFLERLDQARSEHREYDEHAGLRYTPIPCGNSYDLKIIFDYLSTWDTGFKFTLPRNEVLLIGLLEAVRYYDIHGLLGIILETIDDMVGQNLNQLKAIYQSDNC